MGLAVTPSPLGGPLVGESWGGGIARHSQIKGLFFKWIQRRAPLPISPVHTPTRGEGIRCVLSNSLTRSTRFEVAIDRWAPGRSPVRHQHQSRTDAAASDSWRPLMIQLSTAYLANHGVGAAPSVSQRS